MSGEEEDLDVLGIIEAGLQAETFLGGALARKLTERAQKEVNELLQRMVRVEVNLPPDEYKTTMVALQTEICRRENAIHWIADVLQEYVAYEEVAQTQEPLPDD